MITELLERPFNLGDFVIFSDAKSLRYAIVVSDKSVFDNKAIANFYALS
jgi:hypothetical protein